MTYKVGEDHRTYRERRLLQGLILYSLIYDVELPKSVPGLKGKIDLNALAAEMMAMEAKKGL